MEEIIKAEHLTRWFEVSDTKDILDYIKKFCKKDRKTLTAVNDINFTIRSGECVGVIGVNGAGKSTLIKMMTGVLKPSAGRITVLGKDPFEKREVNNLDIGAVFGQRCQLKWDLPPKESYELFRCIYHIDRDIFKERMEELVRIMQLESFIDRPVRTLSLGQRMRAELVGAFLHAPKIVFLDEPTLGLDVFSKRQIAGFLKTIQKENNTTIILTTHDLEDIRQICDRVIILEQGQIITDDSIQKLTDLENTNETLLIEVEDEITEETEWLRGYEWEMRESKIFIYNLDRKSVVKIIGEAMDACKVRSVNVQGEDFSEIVKRIIWKSEDGIEGRKGENAAVS